jgi:hypothetical protein
MTKEDEIKVSFSISVTRTYSLDEIEGFNEISSLVSDDLKTTLLQMIQIAAIEAINDGKGSFKILE